LSFHPIIFWSINHPAADKPPDRGIILVWRARWAVGNERMTGQVTTNKGEWADNNLVEAVEVAFQDALSHRGRGPAPRVRPRDAQGRRATDPSSRLHIALIVDKSSGGRRCHS